MHRDGCSPLAQERLTVLCIYLLIFHRFFKKRMPSLSPGIFLEHVCTAECLSSPLALEEADVPAGSRSAASLPCAPAVTSRRAAPWGRFALPLREDVPCLALHWPAGAGAGPVSLAPGHRGHSVPWSGSGCQEPGLLLPGCPLYLVFLSLCHWGPCPSVNSTFLRLTRARRQRPLLVDGESTRTSLRRFFSSRGGRPGTY